MYYHILSTSVLQHRVSLFIQVIKELNRLIFLYNLVFSAGNAFFFNCSRVLHRMAIDNCAPRIFKRVNRNGVPYITVIVTLCLSCLSYLKLGASSQTVLTWFINISTAAQLVTWVVMCVTFLRWRKAMIVQNLWNDFELPYKSRFLPYGAW